MTTADGTDQETGPGDPADAPPSTPPGPTELETGIFNLAVTLCRLLGGNYGADAAREYVALYLERLATGLRATGD